MQKVELSANCHLLRCSPQRVIPLVPAIRSPLLLSALSSHRIASHRIASRRVASPHPGRVRLGHVRSCIASPRLVSSRSISFCTVDAAFARALGERFVSAYEREPSILRNAINRKQFGETRSWTKTRTLDRVARIVNNEKRIRSVPRLLARNSTSKKDTADDSWTGIEKAMRPIVRYRTRVPRRYPSSPT